MRRPHTSWRQLLARTSQLALAALLPIGSTGLPLSPAPARAADMAPVPCPKAAVDLIDGLYRWHVASQKRREPRQLTGQRERFTPELYNQLVRAYALQPGPRPYLDFDVFSGTQVGTHGATVQDCRRDAGAGGMLHARVAVSASLPGRKEPPQQLVYSLRADSAGRWRIADITYKWDPSSTRSLTTILKGMLQP